MRTVTGKMTAWLSEYADPLSLKGTDAEAMKVLSFQHSDMTSYGWSKAGEATITVELVEHDELVKNKVDVLRKEQTKTRADAHAADVALERQIQELLAITYEAGPS